MTDVWDETLGYYSDKEQSDYKLSTNDKQSELKTDKNGTGGVIVHAPYG